MARVVMHDLYTIPFSHYCEAARWALQVGGIPFKEWAYHPGQPVTDSQPLRLSPLASPALPPPDGVSLPIPWHANAPGTTPSS